MSTVLPRSTPRRRQPSRSPALVALVVLVGCGAAGAPTTPAPAGRPGELLAPEAFAELGDRDARARALFTEATKVFLHPRCVNCHPAGDVPLQGDVGQLHDPPVLRGDDDRGVPALRCGSCHQDGNLELARVPGAPEWHLAPRSMAWVGRTPEALCAQLKDPARNGGRSLEALVHHVSHDALVGWGWAPGHGRAPAPGNQARFGALVAAWVAAGAACPGGAP